jgi:hypothetical protein
MTEETWLVVPSHPDYAVSSLLRVRRICRKGRPDEPGQFLQGKVVNRRWPKTKAVNLSKHGFSTCRSIKALWWEACITGSPVAAFPTPKDT